MANQPLICVVIPTYKAGRSILNVISLIGDSVGLILVIDDACPQNSGQIVEDHCDDPRVVVIRQTANTGVGGAMKTGMKAAVERGADIIVKVDADGQIDPRLIPRLAQPILSGRADYVKGNRFYFLSDSHQMPLVRKLGNLGLSFLTKLSTGYWDLMDPTNGFFALEARVAAALPYERLANRFFFEIDLLFNLGLLRARAIDFPMRAVYGDEESNLSPTRSIFPFFWKNMKNLVRRILYKYFIRDFSLGSLEFLAGSALFMFGFLLGIWHWYLSWTTGEALATGTIIVNALFLMFGFQLLLSFVNFDVATVPREPIHTLLERYLVASDQEEDTDRTDT